MGGGVSSIAHRPLGSSIRDSVSWVALRGRGAGRRWQNSTREAPLLGATHPLCHCLHPCLAFPVVLTQPSFPVQQRHRRAQNGPFHTFSLAVLVQLLDTEGKSSFSRRSQGKASGAGGGGRGGGGGIARRVVDGDGQVVSSLECGGVESGVLEDGNIHGELVAAEVSQRFC